MILIEKTQIMGLEPTVRGMRNPMNSWAKSDSDYRPILCAKCDDCPHFSDETWDDCGDCEVAKLVKEKPDGFMIGPNDLDLMLRLARAGSVDGKFRRMIAVYVDITAPLYWWKEFDTYKVGTVANSCSTMHKIHAKEFTLEDFSCEYISDENLNDEDFETSSIPGMWAHYFDIIIEQLNVARTMFLKTGSEIKKCHFNELEKREELVKRQKQYWWQMIQLLPSSYNQKRTVMLNYEVLANIYQHRRNHKLDEWREVCHWIESLPYSEIITCNVIEAKKATDKKEIKVLQATIEKLRNKKWSETQIDTIIKAWDDVQKEIMEMRS